MPTADHYRKERKNVAVLPARRKIAHERETLLRMAAQWERLAEQRPARKRKKGRPPQLGILPFRSLLAGGEFEPIIQVSNFEQTVTGKTCKAAIGTVAGHGECAMPATDQFWQYANEAVLAACDAESDHEKRELLDLARTWTQAAIDRAADFR